MKKFFLRKNENAKFNYSLIINDGENTEVIELTKKTSDDCLFMPEVVVNETGRKLISLNLLSKYENDYEILPKTRSENSAEKSTSKTVRKEDVEYLDDENDRKLFLSLIEKINEKKHHKLTDIEKAERALQKAQEKYAALVASLEALGE